MFALVVLFNETIFLNGSSAMKQWLDHLARIKQNSIIQAVTNFEHFCFIV